MSLTTTASQGPHAPNTHASGRSGAPPSVSRSRSGARHLVRPRGLTTTASPLHRRCPLAPSQGLRGQPYARQHGQTTPQYRRPRARRGQRHLAPSGQLLPTGTECAQASRDRFQRRAGPLRCPYPRAASRRKQHVGRRMHKHSHLMRREAMPRRARRLHGHFVIFALVFRLSASPGAWPIAHWGTGVLPSRHDKARVDAWRCARHRDDHAARARPRRGLVARRVAARALRPALRLGPVGLLKHLPSQRLQDGMTGQTRHSAQLGGRCNPRPALRGGTVAGAAQAPPGVGPGVPQPLAQPLPHCAPRRAGATLGLADWRAQAPREARRERQRQEALGAIRAIVAGLCLRARAAGRGVIAIAPDARGHPGIRGATLREPHQRHAGKCGACDAGCNARYRGWRGHGGAGCRQAIAPQLEERIGAERVGIVGLFIARRTLQQPLFDQAMQGTLDASCRARV
jgi:hypothetical protein